MLLQRAEFAADVVDLGDPERARPFLLRAAGKIDEPHADLASERLDPGIDRSFAPVVQPADIAVEAAADEFPDRREHPVLGVQCRLAARCR